MDDTQLIQRAIRYAASTGDWYVPAWYVRMKMIECGVALVIAVVAYVIISRKKP